MRIISFAWTAPAVKVRRKTCTRRDWNDDYAKKFKKGDLVAGYDRNPRIGGRQFCTIRLTVTPYKEATCKAPSQDWEAEGFAYLESIGAKVNGLTPAQLWQQWLESDKKLWVIRFEIIKAEEG